MALAKSSYRYIVRKKTVRGSQGKDVVSEPTSATLVVRDETASFHKSLPAVLGLTR